MKLELENIVQKYNDKEIIKSINFELQNGIYGFLGPNGAGKSTTIRMLCTIENQKSGTIKLDGKDIFEMDEEYRGMIGYVPQGKCYYPEFTGEKFLEYISVIKGCSKTNIEKVLKLVNLYDNRKKKIREYSGGMKQRLNIAQAILNNPKILILDEPTVGLDPEERLRLKNILVEMGKNSIILYATHIVSDIEDIADNLIVLNNGEVKYNGKIDNALKAMEGRVWKYVAKSNSEIENIRKKHKITRIRKQRENNIVYLISDEKPCETAEEIEATLEEFYLLVK